MIELDIGSQNVPSDEERLIQLDYFYGADHLAVDTEYNPKTGRLIGFSIALLSMSMYFPVGQNYDNTTQEVINKALDVIKSQDLLVYHNAKNEIKKFREVFDIDLVNKFVCTMQLAHMVDENVISKSLDYLHQYWCGGVGKIMHPLMRVFINNTGWESVPLQLIDEYARQDAVATSELYTTLKPLYEEQFGPLFSC